jgi:hypothetical protein
MVNLTACMSNTTYAGLCQEDFHDVLQEADIAVVGNCAYCLLEDEGTRMRVKMGIKLMDSLRSGAIAFTASALPHQI